MYIYIHGKYLNNLQMEIFLSKDFIRSLLFYSKGVGVLESIATSKEINLR